MTIKLLHGDCRSILPTLADASVHACITSPPYWNLRSYLHADHPDKHREIGSERTPEAYLATMVAVFREVRRVLRPDGVCWVNMGDAFASGSKGTGGATLKQSTNAGSFFDARKIDNGGLAAKNLLMMPARLALALQADGWWLRSMLPWLKRSAMPESVTDRPASAVEYVFLLTRSARYFWDAEAVKRVATKTYGDSEDYGGFLNKSRLKAVIAGERHAPSLTDSKWEPAAGRNMRNSDLFYDSLEPEPRLQVREHRTWEQRKASGEPMRRGDPALSGYSSRTGLGVQVIREPSEPLGLICSDDGEPLALDVNPAAFSEWGQTTRQVYVAWDADVDGKKRKASPDCPVHADQPVPVANAPHDEHAASSQSSRNPDNGIDRGTKQDGGSALTAQQYAQSTGPQSSDLPLLAYGPSATPHSNQSHRTDLAPATNPPCSASARIAGDTGYTSASPEPFGLVARTRLNSIEPAASADNPSSRMVCDSVHTPDEQASPSASSAPKCTCTWYVEKTEKTSHFATFPPRLVEPLIRAGTSERGCCAACGAPWRRTVERGGLVPDGNRTTYNGDRMPERAANDQGANRYRDGHIPGYRSATTTGWAASCQCVVCPHCGDVTQQDVLLAQFTCGVCDRSFVPRSPDTNPCTVLDPFAGAGTTLLVADRLQRDAIGIELSDAYGAMADARIVDDAPLLAWSAVAEAAE
jgi:DNA modification methylase